MNKCFKYYFICWAIVLLVFNIITFVLVGATCGFAVLSSSFWVGYAFIMIVLIGHLICSILFFKKDNKDKVFLNFSIMRLSYIALIVSSIAGLIAMIIPFIPYWIGVVVDVLILGYYAIAITKATAAVDIVQTRGKKVEQKTEFINMLIVNADALKARAKTDSSKEMCAKVYEAIRYSDPMSIPALNNINDQIQNEFDVFSNAVFDGDDNLINSTAEEIINLIELRNKKCKAYK